MDAIIMGAICVTMLPVLLVLAALVAGNLAQTGHPNEMDMYGLINVLYYKADSNRDGTITERELKDIWDAFDQNNDTMITPAEFIPSWAAITGMSQELSTAYFYLADLDDNGQITASDLNLVYLRFDMNGDGTVTAQEFNLKWQQLYREAPYAVLYLRADANKDDDLQANEFSHLFVSLGGNADGSVTKANFQQGWVSEGFGYTSDAAAIFDGLDADHDGVLTTAEMDQLFSQYDVSHNHKVELTELIVMAKLTPTAEPATL